MVTSAHSQAGFTLIEILVAVGIVTLLAAFVLPAYLGAQKRPYDAAAQLCGREIVKAENLHRGQRGQYKDTVVSLKQDVQEVCSRAGVKVQWHSTIAATPGADTCYCVTAGTDILAFQVFHPKGSGFYLYWYAERNVATPGIQNGQNLERRYAW
jgi:type IV pilus assembly protein PilA